MDKIINRIYSKIILTTSIVTFFVWKMAVWVQPKIEELLNDQLLSKFIMIILGVIISYSFYTQINNLVIILCENNFFFKRFFFKDGFFDGKWVGAFLYKNELVLVIVDINQKISSISISCDAYSIEGKYLGSMNSDSVSFDTGSRKLWASYMVFSKDKEYMMNGLINMNYSLNEKGNPDNMKGYIYQTMIREKCLTKIYKVPKNENIITYIEYLKLNHLNEIRRVLR